MPSVFNSMKYVSFFYKSAKSDSVSMRVPHNLPVPPSFWVGGYHVRTYDKYGRMVAKGTARNKTCLVSTLPSSYPSERRWARREERHNGY